MGRSTFFVALTIAATSIAQSQTYRLDGRANGTIYNTYGSAVVHTITGPWSGTANFSTTSFSKVTQTYGNPLEPCPYTLTYANLYGPHYWTDNYSFSGVVNTNVTLDFRVQYLGQDGSERWIHISTDAEHMRSYESKTYEQVYTID